MLALKLEFKFKSLGLIYYFINHEQYGVAIARNMIRNLVSYALEILLAFASIIWGWKFFWLENWSRQQLNFFEMVVSTNSDHTMKLVNWELLIFCKYHMNAKGIKCLLEWWKKHETMFPTFGFLTRKILRIISFQIEIENFFSHVGIFTNLKRICHWQLDNLAQNWFWWTIINQTMQKWVELIYFE
jgi:hypothetical protein